MALDILVVDDEKDICHLIGDILTDEGYQCRYAHTGEQALQEVKKRRPHLILLDIWLGESRLDGLKILELVKSDHADLPVLMMSGHGTIETAVTAIKNGAYDFLEKPFKSDRLLILVDRALEATRLRQENQQLKSKMFEDTTLVGDSLVIREIREMVEKIAPSNSRILLQGPQGSGKETIAREIHHSSNRSNGPFVVLNCACLDENDLEERLFGLERPDGYTAGVLEQAHNGTLYLDAVDEMTLPIQNKIVRALQSNSFQRVKGDTTVTVDVRVISSTTHDLQDMIEAKEFREDLYYRLNVVSLALPSLRTRGDDIPALVDHFIHSFEEQNAISGDFGMAEEALLALQGYQWPGNVRQLRNVVEWVMIMKQEQLMDPSIASLDHVEITIEDLPQEILSDAPEILKDEGGRRLVSLPLREAREKFEKDYLVAQVDRFAGNISKTAEFVGMERSALHRKLKGLQIQKGK